MPKIGVKYYSGSTVVRKRTPRRRKAYESFPRTFRKGYDRTGGFYGKFGKLGTELKFHDTDIDDAVVAVGGAISTGVNIIAQGTGESERIGRKIIIKWIHCKLTVSLPTINSNVTIGLGDILRVMIYIDKQTNGANSAVLDHLETAVYDSFRNLANKGRFIYLLDRSYTLNRLNSAADSTTTMDSAEVIRFIKWSKKLNTVIEFDSTVGAITEMRSNAIGVLYISRTGIVSVLNHIRLRFEG